MNLLEEVEKDSWVLRIILDTFALALDVPLRIYHLDPAKEFYERAREIEDDFKIYFPSKDSFVDHIKDIAETPTKDTLTKILEKFGSKPNLKYELWTKVIERYGDYWYTYRINSYPLLFMLNENWCWNWWQFCWHYYHFIILEPKNNDIKNEGWGFTDKEGEFYMHVSYMKLPILSNVILMVGPVWKPISTNTPRDISEALIEPVVKHFLDLFKKTQQQGMNKRLERLGNTRIPIGKNSLKDRLHQISNALAYLSNMTLQDKYEDVIRRRGNYVRLAICSLFVVRTVPMMNAGHHLTHQKRETLPLLYYRLDHPFVEEEKNEPEMSWVEINLNETPPQLNLCIEDLSKCFENNDCEQVIFFQKTESSTETSESLVVWLNALFSHFNGEIFTKQDANRREYLLILRDWMSDWFGIFSNNGDNSLESALEKFAKKLTHYLAHFIHADTVSLYRYDYSDQQQENQQPDHKGVLDLISLYTSGVLRKKWQFNEPKHMKQAGRNPEQRRDSICYRAFDQAKSKFVGIYDKDNLKHRLLEPPQGLASNRSGIASPLLIYGRTWGILEVLGKRPYQFCISDKRYINEITNVLSNFFYYHWFLDKLSHLNEQVIANVESVFKYDKICEYLSQMLLSYGCALWVLDDSKSGYCCYGVYNRGETQKIRSQVIQLKDKAVIPMAITSFKEKGNVFWQGTIGKDELELNQDWIDNARNKNLVKAGIKKICCIPVKSVEQTDKISACIILYNKVEHDYNQQWTNIMSFVSNSVGIIIQAIEAEKRWQKEQREFVAHELQSNANIILDRAEEIEKWYVQLASRSIINKFLSDLDRVQMLVNDTKIEALDLKQSIELLTEDDFKVAKDEANNPIIAHARELSKKPVKEPIELRHYFNHIFRSEWHKQQEKHLKVNYDDSQLKRRHPFLKMPAKNVAHILRNLYENAIKYSHSESEITAVISANQHVLMLQISNDGKCLHLEEKRRIFQNGYRGKNAEGIVGEGKGLFIIKEICRIYQIELLYDFQKLEKTDFCRHIFTLEFPIDALVEWRK